MPGTALIRPLDAKLAELRRAWVSGRRVAVSVAGGRRVEGHVATVAPTETFVDIAGTRITSESILAVHSPSRLGDSTFDEQGDWHGDGQDLWRPQPEQLPNPDGWDSIAEV